MTSVTDCAPCPAVEVDEPRDVVRGRLWPRRLVPVGWWRAVQAHGAARRREGGGDDAELRRGHEARAGLAVASSLGCKSSEQCPRLRAVPWIAM